ncbi:MAG: magnesium transporter CorA family protein [Sphaerochaeta sp.]|jgi:magnesium transporter|nr:magnesium transporter CorA family protein [Sphaerochaeta sp.]MCI2076032.1 magnesium transporter CorA family protein [Sphaerochaeta sp.]MCI2097736.1 magnesium transporter CorA family protein [Sphaerochaeta sp.]MCI2104539.1 magnesium transporter CorA family protein [Sphaerochaeta sp.]
MITIHESYSKGPGETGGYTWVDARDVNRDDITLLQEKYNIDSDLLADIMDQDEQSRIEKEDTYVDLILRLPALSESEDTLDQQALPLGIVMFPEMIITICQGDSVVLDDFAKKRYRHYPVSTMEGFVISLMGRATMVYIRVLKYLNRRKDQVEGQLHKSIMNYELLQLLQIQKSLVYLTTSLTTNEALLERLNNKGTFFHLDGPDEQDFLEDTITDNKQAIQMANIYTDILTGTMDCFASVISNNMNIIMKRLTIVSISFMLPTFITSFFGMNVKLPFTGYPLAWLFMLVACGISVVVALYIFSDRRSMRMLKTEEKKKERNKSL